MSDRFYHVIVAGKDDLAVIMTKGQVGTIESFLIGDALAPLMSEIE